MSEEQPKSQSTQERDFYRALERMLRTQDALEDERFSIDEYPHNDFAKYFVSRIDELNKNNSLKPISFMHIPFEIGSGTRLAINALTKERFEKYIDELTTIHTPKELSSKELIDAKLALKEKELTNNNQADNSELDRTELIHKHLELWRELKGTRVFDFDYDRKDKHPDWKGWRPKQWGIDNSEFEFIGEEFEFSHSIACLWQLCDAQKENNPVKEKWVLYYWGLKEAKDLHNPDENNQELSDLILYLQKDFAEIIETKNVKYFEQNLKYFNPQDMTLEQMNKFFICSLIKCAEKKEKPNIPFYKRLYLSGRLNKIHCYPLRFLEPCDSKLSNLIRLKILTLKDIVLGNKIEFPAEKKIKNVEEDWNKTTKFLLAKIPFKEIMPMLCSLTSLKKDAAIRMRTGNQENLKDNKETLDKATTIYPILDWVKLSLDEPPDNEQKILATALLFFCEYSANPKGFNEKIMNLGQNLLPLLDSARDEPDKVLEQIEKINDGIVPDLLSLVGIVERIFYPYEIGSDLNEDMVKKIISIIDYLSDANNYSVLAFRSLCALGNVFKHPKILKFITLVDYARNLSWVKEFQKVLPMINKIIHNDSLSSIEKNLKIKDRIDRNNPSNENILKEIEQLERFKMVTEKIVSILQSIPQPGKNDLENS